MVSWFPMRKIKCFSFLFLFFQFHELIHDFSSISCWNEMEKKQGSSRNYYFLFYIFILNLILFFLSFWIFFNFYVIVFSVLGFFILIITDSFSATFITFFYYLFNLFFCISQNSHCIFYCRFLLFLGFIFDYYSFSADFLFFFTHALFVLY